MITQSLRSLHFSQFRVLDKSGGNVPGHVKSNVNKMLCLAAFSYVCCPSIPVDDVVAREIKERHADIIEAVSILADAAIAGDAADVEAKQKAESTLCKAWLENAKPGFFALSPTSLSPVDAVCAANKYVIILQEAQQSAFLHEVSARAVGSAGGQLQSVLRMYTSIKLPKLSSQAGISEAVVRSTLVASKLKSWTPASVAALKSGAADSSAASELLHFFFDRDVVYVEEPRRSDNVSMMFVDRLRQVNRLMSRWDYSPRRGEEQRRN